LRRKAGYQRFGTRIGKHSLHLLVEDTWLPQLALQSQVEQLVIRDAAPKEERQTRSQIDVVNGIGLLRTHPGGILLYAEQELRANEKRTDRHLNAIVEAALQLPFFVELERNTQVFLGHCSPKRAPHEGGKELLRAPIFFGWLPRAAYKQPLTGGCISDSRSFIWAGDRKRVDSRLEPGMPICIEVGEVRLTFRFFQSGALFQEGRA
jgi:hypothetical protein